LVIAFGYVLHWYFSHKRENVSCVSNIDVNNVMIKIMESIWDELAERSIMDGVTSIMSVGAGAGRRRRGLIRLQRRSSSRCALPNDRPSKWESGREKSGRCKKGEERKEEGGKKRRKNEDASRE
jgi:hypothetical protein